MCVTGGPERRSQEIVDWATGAQAYCHCFGQALTSECGCLALDFVNELNDLLTSAKVVIMRTDQATKYNLLNQKLATVVTSHSMYDGASVNVVAGTPFQYFLSIDNSASPSQLQLLEKSLLQVKLGSCSQKPSLTLGTSYTKYVCDEFRRLSDDAKFVNEQGEAYGFLASFFFAFQEVAALFSTHGNDVEDKSDMGKMFFAYVQDPDSAVSCFLSCLYCSFTFCVH